MDTHFISIQLHSHLSQLPPHFIPFIYGSSPLLGSWNPDKAIKMINTAQFSWEVELVIPSCCEELEFKFMLKDINNPTSWKLEEHQKRVVIGERSKADTQAPARFKIMGERVVELLVIVHVESKSPSSLVTMWKAYKEGQKSGSCTNPVSTADAKSQFGQSCTDQVQTHHAKDANTIDEQHDASSNSVVENSSNGSFKRMSTKRSVSVQDLVVLGLEAEKLQSIPSGVDVDCISGNGGEHGSSANDDGPLSRTLSINGPIEDMFDALPTTAATLSKVGLQVYSVADQTLVPKERRRLAIIMVGLPARGKTFTATKLTRYLQWLGHVTKHFNVGQYRRLKHGCNQKADFFRADNQGGLDARNEVAALAMEDMLKWMQEGGQIGIFDATNSTTERRDMLLKMSEGKCKVIFLEVICNDQTVIERNIRLKIQQSPDYKDMPDLEGSLTDFKARLANYEKAYKPVSEGSYIKMIDTVGGEGGQVQVNNISGYLPGRILFFLVNTHTNPRPIFLTRPGESLGSVHNLVGGDKKLSETGEKYAKLLANFVKETFKEERTASVWTSTLQRTVDTAKHLVQFPKVQWRALDDISAGIFDGMTYEEIKATNFEEFEARRVDKLRYRYPRGESYVDVIQRLEPVIIELERQHSPVIIVAHQAVLRSLYGYFADQPIEQIPYIEIPSHTVIEIQMGVVGVEEKRYKLL